MGAADGLSSVRRDAGGTQSHEAKVAEGASAAMIADTHKGTPLATDGTVGMGQNIQNVDWAVQLNLGGPHGGYYGRPGYYAAPPPPPPECSREVVDRYPYPHIELRPAYCHGWPEGTVFRLPR
jgi:hypothetical protein